MPNRMKVIMESWRKFSTLNSILKEETDVSQMNIDKLADIQAKYSSNSEVQQKIQTALVSDSEVKEIASMLMKAMESGVESDSEPPSDATKDLESAGLDEGAMANFAHSLSAAFGQAAVGNMEQALELIGLGKVAKKRLQKREFRGPFIPYQFHSFHSNSHVTPSQTL